MHKYDILTRKSVFRNVHSTSAGKVIQKACSMTLDFESTSIPFHLVQLSGR